MAPGSSVDCGESRKTRSFYLKDGSEIRQTELPGYYLDYFEGEDVLVITFENRDDRRNDANRPPWGFGFLKNSGFAILGVKPKRADWYRGADLHAYFRSDTFKTLVSGFRRVIFYGSSMGGYGALTFATEGAEVIAHNPQSTLDRRLAPWETRYQEGQAQDWAGDFADAADGARRAQAVYLSYDPFFDLDRRQAERLSWDNVLPLKAPMLGHSLPQWFFHLGILKQIFEMVVQGTMTTEAWARLIRARRLLPRYYFRFATVAPNQRVGVACMHQVAKLRPVKEENLNHIVRFSAKFRAWNAAEEAILAFEEKQGATAESRRRFAQLLLAQQRHAEAAAAIGQATELGGKHVETLYIHAQILLSNQLWQEAADVARETIAADPRRAAAFGLLFRALSKAGDIEGAIGAAQDAIMRSKDARYHRSLAEFHISRSEWPEAMKVLLDGITVEPHNAVLKSHLATCQIRIGH
jgi:tetratricopeptide (TPR) repeat protein